MARKDRGIIRRGDKFYISYFDVDKTRRTRLLRGVTGVADARKMLAEAEKRVTMGLIGMEEPKAPDPEEKRRSTITVQEIGEQFTERFVAPRIKNPADYRMEAKSVLTVRIYPAIGKRIACEVTSRDIESLRDSLAEEYAPQSVTNTLNTLSKLYGWSRKEMLIDCDNPVAKVERHQSDDGESITADKYLSRTEAADLLAALENLHQRPCVASPEGAMLYPMAATALYAGLRKGELYGLKWPAVDFERGQIEVSKSYDGKPKSGKTRHVPLAPTLARILRAWRDRPGRVDGGLVFPVEDRMGRSEETLGLGETMQATIGRVTPKCWHGLRHSFAAHLIMSGANILTVSRLLGHADVKTTLIYSHLAPDFMAAEIARLSFAAPSPAGVANLDEERRRRLLEALEARPDVVEQLLAVATA